MSKMDRPDYLRRRSSDHEPFLGLHLMLLMLFEEHHDQILHSNQTGWFQLGRVIYLDHLLCGPDLLITTAETTMTGVSDHSASG